MKNGMIPANFYIMPVMVCLKLENFIIKVIGMDFDKMLGESFTYTKEAIVGKWMQ
jgi:hypothetical protein